MGETQQSSAHVAFLGLPGVGKSVTAHSMDSLSADEIDPSLRDVFGHVEAIPMRRLLRMHGYTGDDDWRTMRPYHEAIRDQGRGHEVIDILGRITNKVVILDSPRDRRDIDYYRQSLGGLIIGFEAPEAVCRQRFAADTFDEKHAFFIEERFKAKRQEMSSEEWQELVRHLRGLVWDFANDEVQMAGFSGYFAEADVVIDANVSPEEVGSAVIGHIRDFVLRRQESGLMVPTTDGEPYGRVSFG